MPESAPIAPWKPQVNEKQMDLIRLCHSRPDKPKYVLVSGPRFSVKSYGCFNCIADHAWNVKNARISVIVPTITAGDDSGCWTILTREILQQWIDGGFGMEWVSEPRQSGVTKRLYCQVTNKHGGISHIQLDSLEHESDAEKKFKGKSFSMMYVSELSYFLERKTFDIWIETLRGTAGEWNEYDYLFIGDTNPADDGEDSWIWRHWYDFRVRENVDDFARLAQQLMALVEFRVSDNTFISQQRLNEQLARYDHSEDLKARYRDGKWVKAVGNSAFFEVFRETAHVIGERDVETNPAPLMLVPEEGCLELLTGWDIGDINHAMVIAEKVYIKDTRGRDTTAFKFLDEVVYIGSDYSTRDFVKDAMEKVAYWEEFMGRDLMWRNWSDRSAFDRRDRSSNIYDHQVVYQESQGKIVLQAADRSPGSIRQRLVLNKKLLFEERMVISRPRCPNLIDSYQSLRRGKGHIAVQTDSKYKHCWDAATYLLSGECYDEVEKPLTEFKTGTSGSRMISVPL